MAEKKEMGGEPFRAAPAHGDKGGQDQGCKSYTLHVHWIYVLSRGIYRYTRNAHAP